MDHDFMEIFGKALIRKGRDSSIIMGVSIVDSDTPVPDYRELAKTFATMSEEQRQAVKELIYKVVDEVLHNVLFVFETSEIATIRLEHEGEVVEDIRKITSGDLQGYAFIWAEEYSKQPLGYPDSLE